MTSCHVSSNDVRTPLLSQEFWESDPPFPKRGVYCVLNGGNLNRWEQPWLLQWNSGSELEFWRPNTWCTRAQEISFEILRREMSSMDGLWNIKNKNELWNSDPLSARPLRVVELESRAYLIEIWTGKSTKANLLNEIIFSVYNKI